MSTLYKNISIIDTGAVGFVPRIILIDTNATYTQLSTPGFVTVEELPGGLSNSDFIIANIADNHKIWLQCTLSNGFYTLSATTDSIILPTATNHIATYNDTNGILTCDPATAICLGNIQSGANGDAGSFISYSATPNAGNFTLAATANSGDYAVNITNAAQGQATVFSLAGPSSASSLTVGVKKAATSWTAGGALIADAASRFIATTAKILYTTQGNIGGSTTINVTFPGCTTTSVVIASATVSDNPANILTVDSGTDQVTITLSADPGQTNWNLLAFVV